jgi:hypothetical protein
LAEDRALVRAGRTVEPTGIRGVGDTRGVARPRTAQPGPGRRHGCGLVLPDVLLGRGPASVRVGLRLPALVRTRRLDPCGRLGDGLSNDGISNDGISNDGISNDGVSNDGVACGELPTRLPTGIISRRMRLDSAVGGGLCCLRDACVGVFDRFLDARR